MSTASFLFRFLVIWAALLLPMLPAHAQVITATKDDNLAAGLRKFTTGPAPNNQITYTTTISNAGATATGVQFSDPDPANTTFVSVNSTPIARNDTYSALGNVQISIPAGSGLLVNDNDPDNAINGASPALTVTSVNAAATQGNVNVNADGSFTFNPTPGFEGSTTFTYTMSDGESKSDTATVTVNITGMIWFVNSTGAAGDGRLTSPFNSLAAFQAVNNGTGNNPAANDNIFLFENATAYTGPVTLLAGQKLIGQDATAALETIAGVAVPAGSATLPAMNSVNATTATIVTTAASTNAIQIVNTASNTVRGLFIGNTTGAGLASTGATFNTLTVSEVSKTGTGAALALSAGTLAASFDTLSSSSSTNAVSLSNIYGTLTVNNAGSALSGASGAEFLVNGGNATITFPGTITNTAGRSIDIQNKFAGTVAFNGAISDTGTGIFLNANTGATINFTGGISASTGANPAFTATGGGTVSATQNNTTIVNTLTTTTGVALNVANTSIGASGITFRSISANGGANGIVLNNTGTAAGNGGLTVVGTGAVNTGGIIQNTTDDGIVLINTKSPSFDRIRIATPGGDGISGNLVRGFSLQNSTIIGAGDADEENGIIFSGVTDGSQSLGVDGTVLIRDVLIDGTNNSTQWGLRIYNKMDGTTLNMNLVRLTIQNTDWTFGEDATSIQIHDGTANVLVDDCDFLTTGQSGFQANIGDSTTGELAVGNFTIQNSTFTNNYGLPAGINFTTNGDGTGRIKITGNTITTATAASAISGPSTQPIDLDAAIDSTLDAIVTGNTITAHFGVGFEFIVNESATGRLQMSSNTISLDPGNINPATQGGMSFSVREVLAGFTNAELNLTLTTNTINGINSGLFGFQGMNFVSGSSAPTDPPELVTIRVNMTGNIVNGTAGLDAFSFRQRVNTTFQIQGLTPSSGATEAQIEAFIAAANSGGTLAGNTVVASASGTTIVSYTAGNPTLPTTPTLPPAAPLLFAPGEIKELGLEAPRSVETAIAWTETVRAQSSTLADKRSAGTEIRALVQPELDSLVAAARARWAATGLTGEQLATLRRLQFEVADLPGWHLGEASGDRIRVDTDAGGNGWFIGGTAQDDALFTGSGDILVAESNATAAEPCTSTKATRMSPLPVRRYADPAGAPAGRIDLLTAILHEMGHALGLDDTYAEADRDSLMYGFLTKGERRFPAKNQAAGAMPHLEAATHFLSTPLVIGDLPAGKTVTITYVVQINAGTTAISTSSQGTVSGTNFSPAKVTDDPQTGTANDATITPIHQPPVVGNVAKSVNEDAATAFTAADFTPAGYSDPNGDAIASVIITSLPANGVLKNSGVTITAPSLPVTFAIASIGNLTYTSNLNYNGADSFGWNASDGTLTAASPATVNVTVNPVNDVPSFTKGANQTVLEDAGAQTVNGWATALSAGPANESAQVLDFIVSNNNNALFSTQPAIAANGTLTYTPAANANGSATVSVQIHDNGGTANSGVDTSAIQTFTIAVTAVNDPPSITGNFSVSTPEETARTIVFGDLIVTDIDNTYPTGFTLTVLNGTNYSFVGNTIQPVSNFNGVLTVLVKVNDGAADSNTFNLPVTVTAVNDAPTITGQNTTFTRQDTPRAITLDDLLVTDVDSTYPTGFSLTVSNGTNYTRYGNTIIPATGFLGTLTVPVQVSDGALSSNVFNLAVTVSMPSASVAPEPGGGFRISFLGNANTAYNIQYTDSLLPSATLWQFLGTRTSDATGAYSIVDIPPADAAKRFYRSIMIYSNNFNAGLGATTLRGTAVLANQAIMLTDVVGGQIGAAVFEGIVTTPTLSGFTAKFNANLSLPGGGVPADGINFAVGDLGAVAWGETGPGTANSLSVGFDTFENGGTGSIGIHAWSNGVHIAASATNPFTSGASVPVVISYNVGTGLTVTYNGVAIFTNQAMPGFSFPAGGKFGIGARTGGAVERAVVDDVEITPR